MTNQHRYVWVLSALLCGCAGAGGRPNWWKSRGNLASAALGRDGATGVRAWKNEKIGVDLGCPVLWSDRNHREYTDSRILVGMRDGARVFLPLQGTSIGESIETTGLVRHAAVSVGEAFPNTAYVTSIADGTVAAQGISAFGLSSGPNPTKTVPGVWRTPAFGDVKITAPTPWDKFVFVGIHETLFALNPLNGKWAVSDGGWSTWLGDELAFNSSPVVALGATSDDDTVVIVVTTGGTAFKLNANDGSVLMKRRLTSRRTPDQTFTVDSSWALSSDSKTIYVAGSDATIHTYVGDALATLCSRLGIGLLHAKPYDPQARGKMERFWRTLREQCLDHVGDLASLHDVQVRLLAWLDRHYHVTPHSSLMGKTPAEVYETGRRKPVDDIMLREALIVHGKRRIRRDATLMIAGTLFEIEQAFLSGGLVTIARSLLDPSELPWVEHEDQRHVLRHVAPRKNAERRKPRLKRGIDALPFDPPGAWLADITGKKVTR